MRNHFVKLLCLFATLSFISCSNTPTLQTYIVDHELQPGFSVFDVPTSVIDVTKLTLTKTQENAYNSIKKLNILAYKPTDNNATQLQAETQKITTLLQADNFEELMRGGNTTDGKFIITYEGNDIDAIDELVIFGSSTTKGLVVIRVLGNQMNASEILSLQSVVTNANLNDNKLKELKALFNY